MKCPVCSPSLVIMSGVVLSTMSVLMKMGTLPSGVELRNGGDIVQRDVLNRKIYPHINI